MKSGSSGWVKGSPITWKYKYSVTSRILSAAIWNSSMVMRRSGRTEKKAPAHELSIGSITLDLDARNAYRSGALADLTAKEFDVIEFLMRNPNRVYSREALLDTIWAYEYRSDIRTVDVHIRRLREKLEENPAEPQHILTKWGVGYYFKK